MRFIPNKLGLLLLVAVGWGMSGYSQNDPTFDAQAAAPIYSMIVQPDGKVMVGGELVSLDGVVRDRIGRVNSDGSLDTGFNPGAVGYIHASALLTNGQILVAGSFTNIGGVGRNRIARLNANGTVDAAFTPGTDGVVQALAVQADGKIVVGGFFTTLNGQPRNCLGRLNADGSLDTAFNPQAGGVVFTVAMQPDGKILVGGGFLDFGGQPVNFICRLNTNGVLETNFVASASSHVHAIAVQPDGRILVGGLFSMMNGQPRDSLARLNADGTLDTNFTASVRPGYQGDAHNISIQCDGKILVGGEATGWSGFPYFGRFQPDGTVDASFVTGLDSGVYCVALQRDGKILRATHSTFVRMTNAPAAEALTRTNSTITWLRGGSAPEVWRTSFESSTNLSNWVSLGAGTRIAGGWQRTGVSAPTNAYIRARGFAVGGLFNSSSWFVEANAGPVVIVSPPASRTNHADTTATFTVLAGGSPTLTYRWRKNGTNLTNTGNVSGATNDTLMLSHVLKADAASYSVLVSNKFGAVTSAVAVLTVLDPFILMQPADQMVNAGEAPHFSVTAAGSAPLRFQWLRNGLILAGQTNAVLTLTNVQGADAGSLFRVVVTNSSGSLTSAVAVLTVNVATPDSLNPVPNYPVRSLAIQPDGKILLSGYFSWVGNYLRVGISRLNADGSMDTNFAAGISGIPFSVALPLVAVQEDGKILLAGGIGWANDVPRNQIARFNPDGTLDLAFNPGVTADIFAMILQADGKIVLGGSFTNLGGAACNHLGRLNSDGTRDTNFVSGASGTVYSLAVQPDGKLLVGGSFIALGDSAIARTNIGRLNSDGSVDAGFNPGADGIVNALALQADGAILVGGSFSILGGQARTNIGRLHPGGALDAAFNPGANGAVVSMVVQTDGRIAVGGKFTTLAGQPRNYLGRLDTNGAPDLTFRPEADAAVNSLALQPDGQLVVGGDFTMLNGQPRAYLGRLHGTTNAAQSLAYNTGTITWLHSGAGPEVSRVFFDASTNGTSLFRLSGTRVAGGWQATGPSLPVNATVRARGWIAGSGDGSSWCAESVIGPVLIERQPANRTNDAQSLATLDLLATGQQPLSFRWLKNGAPLSDGTNLVGSLTATLRLNSVLGSEAGDYRCVVSNAFGSVTSVVATLTVRDPLFTGHPMSQASSAGGTAQFFVSAIGSTPLDYYWLKNGVPLADGGNISGAHSTILTVVNVFGSDAAAYRAVATNVWGCSTSAVATLTVADPLLTANPASQSAQRGQTVAFNVSVTGTQPLAYQWRYDGVSLPDGTASTLVLTNVQWGNVGAYDVIATNDFGSVTSAVATLAVNEAIPDALNPGANSEVYTLALPPDGKILVGGNFTSIDGQTRSRLARLNANGVLDTNFNAGAGGMVFCLALQPDGKILVGGSFTNLAGQARTNLGRLNPDGSPDGGFTPVPTSGSRVMALLPQPDGRIVVGGIGFLGRLHADGALDTNFIASTDGFVNTLAAQADGRILVGGAFGHLNGQPHANLGRLEPNGLLDHSFTAAAGHYVGALVEQADGKILVGGWFTALNGQPRSYIGRLNSDGSLDEAFNPGTSGSVYTFGLQADGRIVVAGVFGVMGGQSRSRIGRLNPDGSLDEGFNPGANGNIYSVVVQPDGSLVTGGSFTSIAGQTRLRIARLSDTTSATGDLSADTTSVTWLRGGAAPEVASVRFETTTNGTDWVVLGDGARIPGGWELAGLSLPVNATLRARGFTGSGGFQSSSSWFVESLIGTPLLIAQPVSLTTNATTTAGFSVTGVSGLSVGYQWFKNGAPLEDANHVSGAQTSTLVLTNVLGSDAAQYQVVLSNAWGSVTSQVASLTVRDPFITVPPVGLSRSLGQSALLSVTAVGTPELGYQWHRNGNPVDGANSADLNLTNVQGADAGNYVAVVSNQFGAVTSAIATLNVNLAIPDAFNPGANASVLALAVQRDEKLLVGGSFYRLAGVVGNLGRLNPDGSPDPGFNSTNSPQDNGTVTSMAVQPDGRVLVASGVRQPNRYLWRMNPNGGLDAGFTNDLSGTINAIVSQTNGEVWVGGSFSLGKPSILTNLARLKPDGLTDTNLLFAVNSTVYSLALQPDGKLLVAGNFTLFNGQAVNRIIRLTAEGALDTNFAASANNAVNCLSLQPDGKILLGGSFTTLNGQPVNRLGRLHSDGTLDAAFNPNVLGTVYTLSVQANGKINFGGTFAVVGGQQRLFLARITSDGSLDPTFNPGANNSAYALALSPGGGLVVGGAFSTILGQYRTNLARLTATGPALQTLATDGSTITWLRDGTAPEVWRTTFEVANDGQTWTWLGLGARIAGGWQLTGVNVASNASVRARGYVSGGQYNGSSWFVESIMGPAVVVSSPTSRTNLAGTVASFYAPAGGSSPLTYQWWKAGQPLTNGGNISGADTSVLTVSNVLGGDAGGYSMVVSNAGGSATSSVANLFVVEPVITSQPVSIYTNVSQTVSFDVAAVGTLPAYQWRKNGTNLPGETNASLVISNAQAPAIASYNAVISSSFGVVTSAVASLALNLALPDALSPEINDQVRALALQPDGKILIGGNFNQIGTQGFHEFGRLNPDGTIDTNFLGSANSSTDTVAVQPDLNILVGGWFNYLNNWPHARIGRFYPDGGLDPAVNPAIASATLTPFVDSLVPQPDGKFLVGGWFTSLAGQPRNYIGRFNADGTLDSFNPGANTHVMMIALQPDGKIIAAGNFTVLGGQTRNRIGRLNSDGMLDPDFDPNANSTVNAVVLQPDGKILVGGSFTTLANQARSYLARLNPDGTPDASFNPSLNGGVSGLALQADGAMVIAGGFTTVGGQTRSGLARVNSFGVVDSNWSPQIAGGAVGGIAIQPDGKILIAGSFTSVCGQPRLRLARVDAVTPAEHRLVCDATGVTWARGGTAPEICGAWVETSADGTNWLNLGAAMRIPGGWRMDMPSLSLNSYVRARGFASGGRWNGSLGLIEDVTRVTAMTSPVILSSDNDFGFYTNRFGFTLRALPGQAIVIEASTDFAQWLPVQTNLVTSIAQIIFNDSQAGHWPRRFYRARVYAGNLPPPAILANGADFGMAPDGFGFNVVGVAGQTVIIETSTNLHDWTALATNELELAPLHFKDFGSTNDSVRFYRGRLR